MSLIQAIALASRRRTDIAPRAAVTRLTLTQFRCYEALRLDVEPGSVVLTGPNGAGKTNLLEALSLLAPGRGLRRAPLDRIGRRVGDQAQGAKWSVAATLAIDGMPTLVGTGFSPDEAARRAIRIDGEAGRGQADLAETIAVAWLTPDMDRLFAEGPSARRRFLDRLVVAHDPQHAGGVRAYEHCLSERQRLLADGGDGAWLDAVEDGMARHGVALAAARAETLRRLNAHMIADGAFPTAHLALEGEIDRWLEAMPALAAEDRLRRDWAARRTADAELGACPLGPHRSELAVRFAADGRPARECSTGEQKALLIAIVLAHAAALTSERGRPPIMLFDEVVAHLDADRREALFATLLDLGAQAWLTGTDESMFAGMGDGARFLRVVNARIIR